jgi:hypothetical protein
MRAAQEAWTHEAEAARTRTSSATSCLQPFVGAGFINPIIVEQTNNVLRVTNRRSKEKRHG